MPEMAIICNKTQPRYCNPMRWSVNSPWRHSEKPISSCAVTKIPHNDCSGEVDSTLVYRVKNVGIASHLWT